METITLRYLFNKSIDTFDAKVAHYQSQEKDLEAIKLAHKSFDGNKIPGYRTNGGNAMIHVTEVPPDGEDKLLHLFETNRDIERVNMFRINELRFTARQLTSITANKQIAMPFTEFRISGLIEAKARNKTSLETRNDPKSDSFTTVDFTTVAVEG